MRDLLFTQLKKFVKEDVLFNKDEEGNRGSKKSGRELLKIEICPDIFLPSNKLFIGQEAERDIRALGLTPTTPLLSWFIKMVETFHSKVATFLQKYFETGLTSETMVSMSGLAPGKHTHALTAGRLKVLINKYSKVVDNIKFVGGRDKVMEEIDAYTVDEEVAELEQTSFEAYWQAVAKLKDGIWPRYEVLPGFAYAMGAKFNDTSTVERKFSDMNFIHQNKQRNRMSQEMLDAHLQIKHGVECKENISKCDKCQQGGGGSHCHEVEKEKAKKLKENTERLERERVAKFREQLKTRTSFYSERVMSTRVYSKQSKEKAGSDGKDKVKPGSKAQGPGGSSSSSGGKRKKGDDGKSNKGAKKLKKK